MLTSFHPRCGTLKPDMVRECFPHWDGCRVMRDISGTEHWGWSLVAPSTPPGYGGPSQGLIALHTLSFPALSPCPLPSTRTRTSSAPYQAPPAAVDTLLGRLSFRKGRSMLRPGADRGRAITPEQRSYSARWCKADVLLTPLYLGGQHFNTNSRVDKGMWCIYTEWFKLYDPQKSLPWRISFGLRPLTMQYKTARLHFALEIVILSTSTVNRGMHIFCSRNSTEWTMLLIHKKQLPLLTLFSEKLLSFFCLSSSLAWLAFDFFFFLFLLKCKHFGFNFFFNWYYVNEPPVHYSLFLIVDWLIY